MKVEIIILRSDLAARSINSYTHIPSEPKLREEEPDAYQAVVTAFHSQCDACILVVSNDSTMSHTLASPKLLSSLHKTLESVVGKRCHITMRIMEGHSEEDVIRQPDFARLVQLAELLQSKVNNTVDMQGCVVEAILE